MPLIPIVQWLLSPLGRWLAIGVFLMACSVGAYVKIRSDAIRQHEAQKLQYDRWRLKNAIDASDTVRRADPDSLLEDDGFKRK